MSDIVLTPAEMTFLIGSKFLPNAEITDSRIAAAARSIKGDGKPLGLAVRTIAGALLGLREEGAITMEYVETKKLRMFTSRHVVITTSGTTMCRPPSIEAALASAAGSAPITATHLVDRWFGPKVDHPPIKAYMPVLQSLITSGLIVSRSHDVDRNAAATILTGHKTKTVQDLEPNREAIAGVLDHIAEWATRWTSFVTGDTQTASRLMSEARDVLNLKIKPDDDGD
jgi:hypothetical protein